MITLFEALKKYYTELIIQGVDNTEHVLDPVNADFINALRSSRHRGDRRALDIGYGIGQYTVELLNRGYVVDAIDLIPALILREKLQGDKNLEFLNIIQGSITDYKLESYYDVVVAKDVLHYLNKTECISLLQQMRDKTKDLGFHYLHMFSDIERRNRSGDLVDCTYGACFSSKELRKIISDNYRGWKLSVEFTRYSEKSFNGKFDYFKANKMCVIAQKR